MNQPNVCCMCVLACVGVLCRCVFLCVCVYFCFYCVKHIVVHCSPKANKKTSVVDWLIDWLVIGSGLGRWRALIGGKLAEQKSSSFMEPQSWKLQPGSSSRLNPTVWRPFQYMEDALLLVVSCCQTAGTCYLPQHICCMYSRHHAGGGIIGRLHSCTQ